MNDKPSVEKQIADFDQAMTMFMATMPGLLWSYFLALREQGFTQDQAFRLARDWQLGTLGKPPQERDR